MQLLKETSERSWYLVQEWETRTGLMARVQYCVWNKRVTSLAPSLTPFYTGYVQKSRGDSIKYYDNPEINVHGGVTFEGDLEGALGEWVGFDMAHAGDEDKQDLTYAVEECEGLAVQMSPMYIKSVRAALLFWAVVIVVGFIYFYLTK